MSASDLIVQMSRAPAAGKSPLHSSKTKNNPPISDEEIERQLKALGMD